MADLRFEIESKIAGFGRSRSYSVGRNTLNFSSPLFQYSHKKVA